MVKKAVVFLLFCIASPAWLAMRSRYGRSMLRYLFVAWVITASLAYALRAHGWPAEDVALTPALILFYDWAQGAGIIYPLSSVLWGMQAVFMLLHRLAIRTGDSAVPHPWHTGTFPLFPGTPKIFDVVGFWAAGFCAWMFFYAPDGSFERGISLAIIPIIFAFAVLAHSLRSNENMLPYRVSEQQPIVRANKPRIARVAPKSRSQDSLVEVFSRRDPALRRITQP
jgi:hypothetical protein